MGFLQDLKFSFRMLAKSPGFTLVAVLTLALGIGVNSTVFTLTNAVLIKGLPYEKADEILDISGVNRSQGNEMLVSYKDMTDYRESKSFTALGAFSRDGMDISDDAAAADRVDGARITANTFSLLGQKPPLRWPRFQCRRRHGRRNPGRLDQLRSLANAIRRQ